MKRRPPDPHQRRDGFLLLEAATAIFLAATMLTLAVHTLQLLTDAEKTAHRRSIAVAAAADVMERLAAQDAAGLAPAALAGWKLAPAAQDALPEGRLWIDVRGDEGAPLRRARVEIRWRDRAGAWVRPVRLTAWLRPNRRPAP